MNLSRRELGLLSFRALTATGLVPSIDIHSAPDASQPETIKQLEAGEILDLADEEPEIVAADLKERIMSVHTNRGDLLQMQVSSLELKRMQANEARMKEYLFYPFLSRLVKQPITDPNANQYGEQTRLLVHTGVPIVPLYQDGMEDVENWIASRYSTPHFVWTTKDISENVYDDREPRDVRHMGIRRVLHPAIVPIINKQQGISNMYMCYVLEDRLVLVPNANVAQLGIEDKSFVGDLDTFQVRYDFKGEHFGKNIFGVDTQATFANAQVLG